MNSSLIHEALTDIDDSMDDEEEITDPDLLVSFNLSPSVILFR